MTTDVPARTPRNASVTAAIREAILNGRFVAGQRLIETDLCEQFSASRGAVRSALVELSGDGLVERVAHRGARVRLVPLEEAIEIYEVRMVLEALCAAKASERLDAQGEQELRAIGTRMRDAVEDGDPMQYRQLNQLLHQRVRELSGQGTAASVLEKLRAQIVRQQFQLATMPGRPKVSLPEHMAIIDAICARDSEAADRAMRIHLASVMDAMRTAAASDG